MKSKFLFLLILSTLKVFSQSSFSGMVIDGANKRPIVNAKIRIAEKSDSLFTNQFGLFQTMLSKQDELTITSKEYKTLAFRWSGSASFQTIELKAVSDSIYKDGMRAFYKQIGEKVKYSAKARSSKIFGTVYISFQIDNTGALNNIKTLKDPGKGLAKEVTRVLELIPPNFIYSEPPKTYILPVQFNLDVISGTAYKKLREDTIPLEFDGKFLEKIVVTGSVAGR